jgi:hypothetical protein
VVPGTTGVDPSVPGAPAIDPATGLPLTTPAPVKVPMKDARVLMGNEKIQVYLQIRINRFLPPPAAPAESASPSVP